MRCPGMTDDMVTQHQSIIPNGRADFSKLDYRVIDASGHSSNYTADHIMVDNPNDQGSRWSSLTNDQNQFLLLKLDRPALVRTITFGKFFKTHVCNLKEFRVLAGSTAESMFEVVHSGLRNDAGAETFPFSFKDEIMQYRPIQWVRIVPMAAWGNNFNFSVWYVELRGVSDLAIVKTANRMFAEKQRQSAWRLCLKFLRSEASMNKLLPSIEASSGFTSEAPLVQALYQMSVERGDFSGAEALLSEAAKNQDLFAEYIGANVPYRCDWERIDREPRNDGPFAGGPSKRGGHQMCWDQVARRIYLFGGWDGSQDLSDFWMFDVGSQSWTCISQDTRLENGPGPRSCHKICLHSERRLLYVFGRFVEQDSRTGGSGNASLTSELYQYDLEAHVWTILSPDVKQQGGPSLVYDHQMAVDEGRNLIYVFGGRVISGGSALGDIDGTGAQYSGLYVYDIDGSRWRCLRPDATEEQPARSPVLRSRIGHSMILDPILNRLYIFAGQRNKDYLADYYVYDIDSDTVTEMEKDTSRCGGPDAGFTQRATIDLDLGEIFLFSGLMRDKPSSTSGVGDNSQTGTNGLSRNTFWVYSLATRQWSRLGEDSTTSEWPCPRFAHQLVYDTDTRTHYLFGGNPGEPGAPKRRLNDLWRLKLERLVKPEDILRRACFLLRRQHYYELCLKGAASQMDALRFLQNQVSAVVNHSDPSESEEFRSLSGWLFQAVSAGAGSSQATTPATGFLSPAARSPILGPGSFLADPEDQVTLSRQQLFDQLASLLPESLRPPVANLVDMAL